MATRDQIVELYVALFQRAPTKEEVEGWYSVEADKPMGEVAADMLFAGINVVQQDPEATFYYPDYLNLALYGSDYYRKIIEDVYKITLNKDYSADPEGIDGWLTQVEKHGGDFQALGETIGDIIYIAELFASGELPADSPETKAAATAFKNRVEVANATAEKVEKFNGDFQLFQSLITEVTDDPATLQQGLEKVEQLAEESRTEGAILEQTGDEGENFNTTITPTLTSEDISKEVEALTNFQTDIAPLLSGYKLNLEQVTYSFPTEIPTDDPYYQQYNSQYGWKPADSTTRAVTSGVIKNLDPYLGLSFEEVKGDNGIIRINGLDHYESGYTGFGFYPTTGTGDGIESDIFITLPASEETLSHELGHGLGLKHPFDSEPVMPSEDDNTAHTIMSYTFVEEYLPLLYYNPDGSYGYNWTNVEGGFRLYDIEALQYLYGGNPTHNNENTTYSLGNLPQNGGFYLIDDRGGIDLLDLSDTTFNNYINLTPGTFSSVGSNFLEWTLHRQVLQLQQKYHFSDDFQIQFEKWALHHLKDNPLAYTGEDNLGITAGSIIENYSGGSGKDIVYDNSGNNIISTGAGDDTIYLLNGGDDRVDGGEGHDIVYIKNLESYTSQWLDSTTLLLDNGLNQIILENVEEFYSF
ncbi:MAG: hypothetical protein ABGW77_02450 [Campylobacterales bacterium]